MEFARIKQEDSSANASVDAALGKRKHRNESKKSAKQPRMSADGLISSNRLTTLRSAGNGRRKSKRLQHGNINSQNLRGTLTFARVCSVSQSSRTSQANGISKRKVVKKKKVKEGGKNDSDAKSKKKELSKKDNKIKHCKGDRESWIETLTVKQRMQVKRCQNISSAKKELLTTKRYHPVLRNTLETKKQNQCGIMNTYLCRSPIISKSVKPDNKILFRPIKVNTGLQNNSKRNSSLLGNQVKLQNCKTDDETVGTAKYTPKVLLKNLSPCHLHKRLLPTKIKESIKGEHKIRCEKLSSISSVPIYKEVNVRGFEGYVQIYICPKKARRVRYNPLDSEDEDSKMKPRSEFLKYSPSHYNCMSIDMLEELCLAFESAQEGPCKGVLLTSVGNIFSSGLDLRYFLYHAKHGDRESLTSVVDAVRKFVNCLIHFTKPIVAAVQGPAVGLGAAMLCLCDIVLADERACFHMPYPQQGLTPDGCASFLLPTIVGQSLANSILYGNKTVTSSEAYKCGLFSEVLPHDSFMRHVVPRIRDVCASSMTALKTTKRLIRTNQLPQLVYANECENRALKNCLSSSECLKTMRAYVQQHIT